jgi:hypothetical protein
MEIYIYIGNKTAQKLTHSNVPSQCFIKKQRSLNEKIKSFQQVILIQLTQAIVKIGV